MFNITANDFKEAMGAARDCLLAAEMLRCSAFDRPRMSATKRKKAICEAVLDLCNVLSKEPYKKIRKVRSWLVMVSDGAVEVGTFN